MRRKRRKTGNVGRVTTFTIIIVKGETKFYRRKGSQTVLVPYSGTSRLDITVKHFGTWIIFKHSGRTAQ